MPAPIPSGARARFNTTAWDVVRLAGEGEGQERQEALAQLCQTYWYPLYAYLRGRGDDAETATDHVQSFFADFLGRKDLERVGPEGGPFRAYLLGALKHHVAKRHEAARAIKRGGAERVISIEGTRIVGGGEAEERYSLEPADERTPQRLFDRSWAVAVLEETLERLRAEHEERGRLRSFVVLKEWLGGPPEAGRGLPDAAEQLERSVGATKVALHRLRTRYKQLLRVVVAETVGVDGDVELELAEIRRAFD